ncbi:MAG TPA: DUF4380 domain-containing protein [Victivallales bacterium]|nr:DUF4380 domain-containing protein [Victivallales bacterium]
MIVKRLFLALNYFLIFFIVFPSFFSCYSTQTGKDNNPEIIVNDFNTPFNFSYLDWKDKVKTIDGIIFLEGVKSTGGCGFNVCLDLSAYSDYSPALKLRVKTKNTAKMLKLIFSDSQECSGHWEFLLPESSDNFITVIPKWGAAISNPNRLEDKKTPETPRNLDLTKIIQYQLVGDWQKETLDLEIDKILLIKPDDKILVQRKEGEKQREEEALRKAKLKAEEQKKLSQERDMMIKSYGYRGENSPEVIHVSTVAPDILALTVQAQKVKQYQITKYIPQDGDEKKIEKWKDGTVRRAELIRNGKRIGMLQGKNLDFLILDEKLEGDPLIYFLADEKDSYEVISDDDSDFKSAVKPVAVYRKSKPVNWRLPWSEKFPVCHQIYLKMPSKIKTGKKYTIKIINDKLNIKNPVLKFNANPNVRCESIHVNQIGFRPDDPVKCAFMSVWLGSGGACEFPEGLKFNIVDDQSNKVVYTGIIECILKTDGEETLWTKEKKNFSKTPIYKLDFSDFKTVGKYRIVVEGVGCSYPFEISHNVWEKAFLVQMKGLYNQRSGTILGPPYSNFKKERDFYPGDGPAITRSKYDVLINGDQAYSDIAKEDTGEPVNNAWGGYHDAGDWNPRRVTHMWVTLAQLELVEMYPEYFNKLDLNIPKVDGIPDIITEALFEIDCFRRMQLPDGGIPFGIETDGDPSPGEVSWLTTQHAYVTAPNIRDSWFYSSVAARAAKVLKPINPELSKIYEESAIKAFNWAEADYAKRESDGSLNKLKELWRATDARNLAALILYDLTGDPKWHEIFLKTTCLKTPEGVCWWGKHIQCDAAFLYARLKDREVDSLIKGNALKAVLQQAERSLEYAAGNAFNLTTMDKYRPLFAGFFSTSGGTELARAHYLTGDRKYLDGVLRSCQFQSGCNPNNIVYTTGLGVNPVKNPLHLDSRSTGQPAPDGLTVFGNLDYWHLKGGFYDWPIKILNHPDICWPLPYDWPLTEAYFDIFLFVSMNEFVVDTWAPNVFVWGYLAARPESHEKSFQLPSISEVEKNKNNNTSQAESNLLKLVNDKLILGILPNVGGHIVLLRAINGQNILKSEPELWNKQILSISAEKPEFYPYNGHIYWVGPQKEWWTQQEINPEKKEQKSSWPPDPFLTLGKYDIMEQTEDSVKLKSPPSPVSGLQIIKEFRIKDNKVFLKATAINIRNSEVSWDIWSNTRFPGDAKVYVPVNDKGIVWMEFRAWTSKNRVLPYQITDGFLNFDNVLPTKDNEHIFSSKTFITNPSKPLIAAFYNNYLFIKRTEEVFSPKDLHPEHGFIEIYKMVGNTPDPLTELEMHGPYKILKTNESISFSEIWEIIPCPELATTESRINFLKKNIQKINE